MAANKKPNGGHVIYDSGADMATGKKRAVLPGGGGVSVAERARLFGAQIPHSSPEKAYNSASHVTGRPPLSNQSTKSNVIHQERNYQPRKTDIDQRPKQNTSYSNPPRTFNTHRSATDINERSKREQLPPPSSSSTIYTQSYSKAAPSYNNHKSQSPPRRRPVNSYDSFQHVSPQTQTFSKTKHVQRIPSDTYSSEEEDTYSALYDRPRSSRHPNYQSSNYFRPIQDPLEVLFKDAPKEYIQFQAPVQQSSKDTNNLQPFDLGSLINRIQQDYMDNARPYVSSVQFVQHDQSLANIGFLTPATSRKDYSKRAGDIYNHRAPISNHYDVIDTNGFYPYEKMRSKSHYTDNNYSSIRRRRHHKRYHNQASSPIHVLEISSATKSPLRSESPPVTSIAKIPTPVAESSSEEEATQATTQPDATKTEATESESEEESEEEEEDDDDDEEEESAPAPALPPSIPAINGTARSAVASGNPTTQVNGNTRSTLPNQTPTTMARNQAPVESESEDSDSEKSESESDSDSDDDDKKKKKKKKKPIVPTSPAARSNPPRTTTLGTPQANARAVPQRGAYEKYDLNQPQESSNPPSSYEIPEPEKSGSIGGKLKSFTSKFRRNKS
ncbi:hypothetical protein I4U23_002074 [Adineta vaga]|nr:hypothetical protein I4U23_002074 [Adineta vaga]